MTYSIRKAERQELDRILELYAAARNFMRETGNPSQWNGGYPSRELLEGDMAQGRLYVIAGEDAIHGVFYFSLEEDPTYREIYEGQWHTQGPYGTIHRIAGDGSGGILRAAVAFGKTQAECLRIDTHEDNRVMQRALDKQGFHRCGIIHLADGSPRIAYDLTKDQEEWK